MLVTGNTPGNDLRFSEKRVESARNFANKIWNASRFLLMNLENFDASFKPTADDLELADRWIISRLNRTAEGVTENLDKFELGEAARLMYDFIWSEFCDWYIELTKARLYGSDARAKNTALYVLNDVLEKSLRLLHPFMPFLTEIIRQKLPNAEGSIMLAPWVRAGETDDDAETQMQVITEIIKVIRNLKNEIGVEPRRKSAVVLKVSGDDKILRENMNYIVELAAAEPVTFSADKPQQLKDLIDTDKEIARLSKELDKLKKGIAMTEGKLKNEKFISKAPADVVQAEREKLAVAQEKISSVEARIEQLKNL